jgi:hypothetical protein
VVIHENLKLRTLWGSQGTNAWYVSPSLYHYQCNHYFVLGMHVYRISGSAKLFPQHCQVPNLMWNEYLQEVITELMTMLNESPPKKQAHVLTKVQQKLASGNRGQNWQTLSHPTHKWLLPPGDMMPAIHSSTRTKGGTKGGG